MRVSLSVFVLISAILYQVLPLLWRKEFATHANATAGIVIISGASSGIGRATCGFLAERYPNITFYCGVRSSKLVEASNTAKKKNIATQSNAGRQQESSVSTGDSEYPFAGPTPLSNVHAVLVDVTKDEHVNNLVQKVHDSGRPLLGLINNAGIFEMGTVEYQDMDTIRWHYEVNVFGSLRLTKAVLPLIRQSKGRVLFVSSVTARLGMTAQWSSYVGSKAAMEAVADGLRQEVQPYGVSVSLMEPGMIWTELNKGVIQTIKGGTQQQNQEEEEEASEEANAYPWLFTDQVRRALVVAFSTGSPVEETCHAMEHALFDKHPHTRYVTARVMAFPSWLLLGFTMVLPDRLTDVAAKSWGLMLLTLDIRNWVEERLGLVRY